VFLWILGAAALYRSLGMESIFRAPWLGYALLVCLLQLGHLFVPLNKGFSTAVVAGTSVLAILALLLGGFRAGWAQQKLRSCQRGPASSRLRVSADICACLQLLHKGNVSL
jgi:hypothetical protein